MRLLVDRLECGSPAPTSAIPRTHDQFRMQSGLNRTPPMEPAGHDGTFIPGTRCTNNYMTGTCTPLLNPNHWPRVRHPSGSRPQRPSPMESVWGCHSAGSESGGHTAMAISLDPKSAITDHRSLAVTTNSRLGDFRSTMMLLS